jgi:hypothetical protein
VPVPKGSWSGRGFHSRRARCYLHQTSSDPKGRLGTWKNKYTNLSEEMWVKPDVEDLVLYRGGCMGIDVWWVCQG